MNYEIVGKLIFKEETQHISDRFQKREFVIEVENEKNSQWNDFVKVQLIQDRCDLRGYFRAGHTALVSIVLLRRHCSVSFFGCILR